MRLFNTSAPLVRFLSSVVVSESTALLADVLYACLIAGRQACEENELQIQ